jgi:anti-sigma factor RsiW
MKEPSMSATSKTTEASGSFSAEERAAMKARAAELKNEAKRGKADDKAAAEKATMMAKIAETPQPDRGMAERLHEIVTAAAPELLPKLYYGQPGWAPEGGKVVIFFRSGLTDKDRYSTLGFSSAANLDDDGGIWPSAYALREITDDSAATITELVKKAVS